MDKFTFVRRADPNSTTHPSHQEPIDQIAKIYGELTERGFTEKALMIPRDPDNPDDHVLYIEFMRNGDELRVRVDRLDLDLTDEEAADILNRTVEFMKSTLSMLVFSGKGHYQDSSK